MRSLRPLLMFVAWTTLFVFLSPAAQADEGMWLFNRPPKKLLQHQYNFDATDAWLKHLQQASLRINNGGSGSFVSADGLVMTNQHVGADALEKLSTKSRDLLQSGFYARNRADELKCPDSEVDGLVSIEDVTDRLSAAVHDRPRRVGGHPSPRPYRIVLARKEPRHRGGIKGQRLRRDGKDLSVLEIRRETQSVQGCVRGEPTPVGGAAPDEEVGVPGGCQRL